MLCEQCIDLFGGEAAQDDNTQDDTADHITKKDSKTYLVPPRGCTLCHKIYQRLSISPSTSRLFQQDGTETVVHITRELHCIKNQDLFLRYLLVSVDNPAYHDIFAFGLHKLEEQLRKFFPPRDHPIEPTSDSESTFSLARTWLEKCTTSHPLCSVNRNEIELPTRLLKLDFNSPQRIYLIETSTIATKSVYMTLSHCWGKAEFLTLTTATSTRLQSGIETSALAKTFQDAVRIALQLGVEYLWIDSLCIFQDSAEDWQKEAPRMTDVYRGAVCNIGASASRNSDEGCFRTRDPTTVPPCLISTAFVNNIANSNYVIEVYDYSNLEHDNNQPLFSRGWVFQERVLAPRMLHFGSDYVFWECKTMRVSEKYPIEGFLGDRNQKIQIPVSFDAIFDKPSAWESSITEYSGLAFTRASDKLIAISGVAKHLQRFDPSDRYFAGIWESNLLFGLLWAYHAMHDSCTITPAQARSPYRAPSWSWASVTRKIRTLLPGGRATVCDVENVQIRNVTRDIYSEVLEGVLTMRGQLLRCDFDMKSWIAPLVDDGATWSPQTLKLISLDRRYSIELLAFLDLDDDLGFDTPSLGTIYAFPVVASDNVVGLLLRRAGNVAGRYERCGIFNCWQDSERDHNPNDSSSDMLWKNVVERGGRGTGAESVQPLHVSYHVGPNTEVTEEPEVWKEYQEFDGQDYLFSIV